MAKKRRKKGGVKFGFFGPFTLALLSFGSGFLGQMFLFTKRQLGPGLFFFAIAILLFIIADVVSRKKEKTFSDEPDGNKVKKKDVFKLSKRTELIVFLIIMVVAIFFRIYMIDTIPSGCYRDEGQNGNEAINIMNDVEMDGTKLPVYIERFTQNAAMYMYFVAANFKMFGIGVLQIRLVSIILGVLSVAGIYFMIRYMFGVRMAVIAGLILAVMRWHVNFSRMGFLGVFTVMLFIVAFYFAYRVYKERRLFDFLGLGFVTSLSLYSYIAARLIPLGLLIFMGVIGIIELVKYFRKREYGFFFYSWKKIVLALVVFLIVLAPLGTYIFKHLDAFMTRTSTVSIFNQEMLKAIGGTYVGSDGQVKKWPKLYMKNLKNTMLMFNYVGDGNPRHNYGTKPMLDFLSGIFFIIGFGYILFRAFNPYYFMYLAMWFALIQAGLASIESPQAYRTIVIIPLVVIAIVVFFDKMWKFCEIQYGDKLKVYLLAAFVMVIGVIGFDNYESYFKGWAQDSGAWAEFSTDEYNMGKYLKELGPDWEGVVNPAWVDSYTFVFATYPNKNYVKFSPSEWIPIKSKVFKNYVYILDVSYLPLVPVLKKMYPGGQYTDFKHKFGGRILYFTYEVPYSEIKRYQSKAVESGLTGRYYRDDHTKDLKDITNHWKGKPQFSHTDPFILFNWTVDPIMGPFSVQWDGYIAADTTGAYEFLTKSNDYSDLFIDGVRVLKNPGGGGGLRGQNGVIKLTKGKHKIKVRYYESVHYSKMQLWWKAPGMTEMQVITSDVLSPK